MSSNRSSNLSASCKKKVESKATTVTTPTQHHEKYSNDTCSFKPFTEMKRQFQSIFSLKKLSVHFDYPGKMRQIHISVWKCYIDVHCFSKVVVHNRCKKYYTSKDNLVKFTENQSQCLSRRRNYVSNVLVVKIAFSGRKANVVKTAVIHYNFIKAESVGGCPLVNLFM